MYNTLLEKLSSCHSDYYFSDVESLIESTSLKFLLAEEMKPEEANALRDTLELIDPIVDQYIRILESLDYTPTILINHFSSLEKVLNKLVSNLPRAAKFSDQDKITKYKDDVADLAALLLSTMQSIDTGVSRLAQALQSMTEFQGEEASKESILIMIQDKKLPKSVVQTLKRTLDRSYRTADNSKGFLQNVLARFKNERLSKKQFIEGILILSYKDIVDLASQLEDLNSKQEDAAEKTKEVADDVVQDQQEDAEMSDLEKIDDVPTNKIADYVKDRAPDLRFSKEDGIELMNLVTDNDNELSASLYTIMKRAVNSELGYNMFESKRELNSLKKWKLIAGIEDEDDVE